MHNNRLFCSDIKVLAEKYSNETICSKMYF
nr:MAG TPA: hypothetical protein [Caudoviricetes sp.]